MSISSVRSGLLAFDKDARIQRVAAVTIRVPIPISLLTWDEIRQFNERVEWVRDGVQE